MSGENPVEPLPDLGGDSWHDSLSAHLDGEIAADEQRHVLEALGSDAGLRAELAWVAQARAAVQGLPAVDPLGRWDALVDAVGRTVDLQERRHRRRGAAGAVVTAAAVWLVAVAGLGGTVAADGTPVVASLISEHRHQVDASGQVESSPSVAVALPSRFVLPAEIRGFELVSGDRDGDELTALYRAGNGLTLTVWQRPGQVDWERMPASGRRVIVADLPAWQLVTPTETVLVVQRGEMVHAFVAGHGAHLDTVAVGLPEPAGADRSLWSRVTEVAGDTVELFGFG